jgi:hypothetical protein
MRHGILQTPLRAGLRGRTINNDMAIEAFDSALGPQSQCGAARSLVNAAGSDGRRNTPLIGWSHNSLQKEPTYLARMRKVLNSTTWKYRVSRSLNHPFQYIRG